MNIVRPALRIIFFTHLCSRHKGLSKNPVSSFKESSFQSSVYSTFNAHKSKEHKEYNWRMFKSEIVSDAGHVMVEDIE